MNGHPFGRRSPTEALSPQGLQERCRQYRLIADKVGFDLDLNNPVFKAFKAFSEEQNPSPEKVAQMRALADGFESTLSSLQEQKDRGNIAKGAFGRDIAFNEVGGKVFVTGQKYGAWMAKLNRLQSPELRIIAGYIKLFVLLANLFKKTSFNQRAQALEALKKAASDPNRNYKVIEEPDGSIKITKQDGSALSSAEMQDLLETASTHSKRDLGLNATINRVNAPDTTNAAAVSATTPTAADKANNAAGLTAGPATPPTPPEPTAPGARGTPLASAGADASATRTPSPARSESRDPSEAVLSPDGGRDAAASSSIPVAGIGEEATSRRNRSNLGAGGAAPGTGSG